VDGPSPAAILEFERDTLLEKIAMEEADVREALEDKAHICEQVSTSPPPLAGLVTRLMDN